MEVHAHARQQSQDKKIRIRIYGNWYLATVVGRKDQRLEYRLDEPVFVHLPRKPLFGFIPRKPLRVSYLPKGHQQTINMKHNRNRLLFQ